VVDKDQPSSRELLFLQVISMFEAAAMQQLGKIMDATAGKVNKDLAQAKMSIDILDVLKEKTKGNLTEVEREFLDKVLFELHMNYVDELKTGESESEKAEGDVDAGGDAAEGRGVDVAASEHGTDAEIKEKEEGKDS
jgi:hypothetical protein